MKAKLVLLVLAVVVVMVAACSKQQVRSYEGQSFAATNPESVEVLMSFPSRSHVKIGAISVRKYKPGFGEPTLEDAQEMIQEAGAELGANAVVVVSTSTDQNRQRQVQGEAIRWTD